MLCYPCGRARIDGWRGWPRKNPVPEIPSLLDNRCPVCGGSAPLDPSTVMFVNIHGPYSTGLPDYFELRIFEPGDDGFAFYPKWGLPYVEGSLRPDQEPKR